MQSGEYIAYAAGELKNRDVDQPYDDAYTWDSEVEFIVSQMDFRYTNLIRYVNSCGDGSPNVVLEWHSECMLFVKALKNIIKGEELLATYSI